MTRAAVLGAGSWGTTFAKVLADAGTSTVLWARRPELATAIDKSQENVDYLPGLLLPSSLRATHDPEEALAEADLVILAVPSQTLRENLARWADMIPGDATLVSLMKGVELGTHKLMSEVICEVAQVEPSRVAVLSGPNLAHEIAREEPTATVIASTDPRRGEELQRASSNRYFRPYTNSDVVGTELGGAVKNVIALACGLAHGLGWTGDNTMATVITRGLAETTRLGAALGADPRTFAGLAGMGDLVATCTSPLSRNRSFGEKVGRGMSIEEILAGSHQVAEGYKSCRSILELGEVNGVDLPIVHHVVQVLHEGMSPQHIVASLMGREAGAE